MAALQSQARMNVQCRSHLRARARYTQPAALGGVAGLRRGLVGSRGFVEHFSASKTCSLSLFVVFQREAAVLQPTAATTKPALA